jgi:hypothetical protein
MKREPSKHPGPWTLKMSGDVVDNNGNIVCTVASRDPETRAILLHAAEMFAALRDFIDCGRSDFDDAQIHYSALLAKIEDEIAAARKP